MPRVSAMIAALRHDVRTLACLGALVIFPATAAYASYIRGALPYSTVATTLCCIAALAFIQLLAIHFQAYPQCRRTTRQGELHTCGRLSAENRHRPSARNPPKQLPAASPHHRPCLPSRNSCRCASLLAARLSAVHTRTLARSRARVRSRAKFVLIQRVAGVAYYQSDFVILSITTSLVLVKDYAKFQYVAAALLSVVGLVAASLTTSVARLQLRNHAENRRSQYLTAQFAISIVGAVLMLAFWFSARVIVQLVFGGDPSVSQTAIVLFGIALFLNIIKAVDDIFIMAGGAFHIGWWIPAMEVPIYVLTGVLLSRRIGLTGILIASIATNVVVSIAIKGMVLAGPVFDSTHRQWYLARFWSMTRALVSVAPLVVLYMLAPKFLHPTWLRFLATNLVALGYMLAGVRQVVFSRTTRLQPVH